MRTIAPTASAKRKARCAPLRLDRREIFVQSHRLAKRVAKSEEKKLSWMGNTGPAQRSREKQFDLRRTDCQRRAVHLLRAAHWLRQLVLPARNG